MWLIIFKNVYFIKVLAHRYAQRAGGQRVGRFVQQNQIKIIHNKIPRNSSSTSLEQCMPCGLGFVKQ